MGINSFDITQRTQSVVDSNQDDVSIEEICGSVNISFAVTAARSETPAVDPDHDGLQPLRAHLRKGRISN